MRKEIFTMMTILCTIGSNLDILDDANASNGKYVKAKDQNLLH
jgi:hypothetical protein